MGPRQWMTRLVGALGFALALTSCGDGGGGSGRSCHPAEALASAEADPVADANVAIRPLLGLAAGVQGSPDVAGGIAPAAAPGYQSLEVGKRGTWEVGVLQLADRPRTLQVDFGDGGGTTIEVPAGTGACVFDVSHSFDAPAERRPVRFTLAGGPSFEVFVDVVPKS